MAGYTELIAAGTTLATSDFKVEVGTIVQLVGFGYVSAGDTFDVLVSYDGGTTYVACFDENGNAVKVGAGGSPGIRNPVNLIGPGFFQVKRAAGKTDSIGVALIDTTMV